MTSIPSATLVVILIAVFVVLFVLSVYWLLFRKHRSIQPPPIRPHAVARRHGTQPFDSCDNEWEASAPHPEHVMQHARFADQTRQLGSSFRDTRERIPDDAHSAQDLHDAWESFQEALEPEPPASHSASAPSLTPVAQVRCPRCLSSRIDTRNLARKAGSTIGSVAGATGGMAAALAGAETGAVVGSVAGPLGSVFGGLAGAVIAGLAGSAAGCAAGSVVGAAIDDNVLDNHLCLACGHAFSVAQD